ncbi:hypothetical protein TorRG33x02_258420, partial [Trema orientale]
MSGDRLPCKPIRQCESLNLECPGTGQPRCIQKAAWFNMQFEPEFGFLLCRLSYGEAKLALSNLDSASQMAI